MEEIQYHVVDTRTDETLFSSPILSACTRWINKRFPEEHPDFEYIFIVCE